MSVMNQQRNPDFLSGISSEEGKAIEDYTSGSGDYGVVNTLLREGEQGMFPGEIKRGNELVGLIDSVIEKAPTLKEGIVTYRGIWGQEALSVFTNMKPGDTFIDSGFSSTSLNRKIAENFARSNQANGGIVLEIVNPKGSKGIFPLATRTEIVKEYVEYTSEKEWLLPRNSKFKVLSVEGKNVKVEVQ
jgi:hypothetical protein